MFGVFGLSEPMKGEESAQYSAERAVSEAINEVPSGSLF